MKLDRVLLALQGRISWEAEKTQAVRSSPPRRTAFLSPTNPDEIDKLIFYASVTARGPLKDGAPTRNIDPRGTLKHDSFCLAAEIAYAYVVD
jgi:hypothetical protein